MQAKCRPVFILHVCIQGHTCIVPTMKRKRGRKGAYNKRKEALFDICEDQHRQNRARGCRLKAKVDVRVQGVQVVVIFKRIGSRALLDGRRFMAMKAFRTKRTRLPCGEEDCKTCGVFCREYKVYLCLLMVLADHDRNGDH